MTNSAPAKATNVILHAFDWPYQRVAKHAQEIANAGYKTVLVSPPMKSHKSQQGTKWWQRYQPQDYRIIDNQLGNTLDFKAMTTALKKHDIDIYVDVVFNHMANEAYLRSDLNYPSADIQAEYCSSKQYFEELRLFGDLSSPLFTEYDFVNAFPIKDWNDPWQVQHGRISGGQDDPGLPTLKCNENVVKQQQKYLIALKQLGVKGFRIDAAKHLTLEHIQQVWNDEISEGVHIFGEIITNGGASKEEYNLFLEPYLKDTNLGAYDFPLFHSIFNTMEKDAPMTDLVNPYSVGEALAYDRAITFAITHDIPNNDVFLDQVMSEESEMLAYSYILGRDGGVPLIYSDLDTSGINNQLGAPRWLDDWSHPTLVRMIQFHNTFHCTSMKVLEVGENHLMFKRGEHGIVALNKGSEPISLTLPGGKYKEALELNGVNITYHGDTGRLTLAPTSCAMLYQIS
ncbi:alpha-amylase family glycosyl hydrolase [Photobacterium sanctipauli]|uniref:alpha-amylase family glycosyl hydrolase n=1 Tax=Photobacterium sanctipauli TaxID=1342794 RepID=UPI0005612326|nr:alpha-amylase family glycosyl hydrolase [Photobacterium sanctipauli]